MYVGVVHLITLVIQFQQFKLEYNEMQLYIRMHEIIIDDIQPKHNRLTGVFF